MNRLSALAISILALLLTACQTADPPEPETNLRLSLNDSLSRYEKIIVQLLDRNDSTKVLLTVWNAPLLQPANQIPVIPLKTVGSDAFIVKITGYKAMGQLALQTMIFYEPNNKTVRHDYDLPPLKPLAYLKSLTPSIGTMSPEFHRDSLTYRVTLPQNVNQLSFGVKGSFPGVKILVDSTPVASGSSSKILQIGSRPVLVVVTDSSSGAPVTRTYTVTVIPTLPPGVRLASLVPSVGKLSKEFTPEQQVYAIYLPVEKDTISFRVSPADTRTMTVTIDNQAAFPGVSSQIFTVPVGITKTIGIIVKRGNDDSYYQVTIDHTQTSDH